MAAKVTGIAPGSPADGLIRAGDTLLRIGGEEICDVLDYMYHGAGEELDAVHARHAKIDDQHRDLRAVLEGRQRRGGQRLGDDVEPLAQRAIEQVEVVGFVVDAQHDRARGRSCVGRTLMRRSRIVGYCQCR